MVSRFMNLSGNTITHFVMFAEAPLIADSEYFPLQFVILEGSVPNNTTRVIQFTNDWRSVSPEGRQNINITENTGFALSSNAFEEPFLL